MLCLHPAGGMVFLAAGVRYLSRAARFAGVLLLVAGMFLYGLFIRRGGYSEGKQHWATAAYVSGNILLLFLLSAEVYGFYNARAVPGEPYAERRLQAQSALEEGSAGAE